ncbi:MAG: hypothetical protein AMJ92_06165 [candidate division Zixibacteria bacterium SM23_81]|nr:MAG: hypothetical protein AMJ92_06165 [candidate division Zixibacteria bacterium SM23_81]
MFPIDDLIATLGPDHPVQEVRVGAYWIAVLSRHLGLASALRDECPGHPARPVEQAGHLTEKSALELCQLAHSDSLLETSIGLAAINSMLPEVQGEEVNAEQLIVEKGTGKGIAIIGHFPFVTRIKDQAEALWVLEKRLQPGDLPESAVGRILPLADVIAISATTLINHTLDGILKSCRKDSFRIMLGATTPLSPVLLDNGLDALCGVQIADPQMVLTHIQEGAIFRQVKGVRLVCIRS